MGKFDGYLICSDFDGTLAGPGSIVSQRNLDAIALFQAEGGRFTLASGRNPLFLKTYCDITHPNAPVMSLNGGILADPVTSEVKDYITFEEDPVPVLEDLTGRFSGIHTIHAWHTNGEMICWELGKSRSVHETLSSPREYVNILMIQDKETMPHVRDEATKKYSGRFLFESSWPEGIEMMPASGGKGAALARIKRLCDTPISIVIGMGDYENDVSLLRMADLGIAVGNALERVKQAADLITVPNTQDALWHVITELLEDQSTFPAEVRPLS